MRRKSAGEIVGWVLLGIIAVAGLAILFGFIIMWLWNWLMPALFGLGTINYWQAVGIFILSKILLGGCVGKGSKHRGSGRSRTRCESRDKGDFSKWKHYGRFWKEEGEQAFNTFLERQGEKNSDKAEEL